MRRRFVTKLRTARKFFLEPLEERYMFSAAQIVAENQLPGTPESVWDVPDPSSNIEGFAAQYSVDLGQTVQFKVNTDASAYHLDIYRIGYYQGDGARLITTIKPTNVSDQPDPNFDLATNSTDASNWHVSASWNVPTTAVSGVYVADIIRDDGTYGANQIVFVVRDDGSTSDMLFQTSDTTWEAYNTWGGSSLYTPDYPAGRAYAVSYARPFANRTTSQQNYFFADEYPMVRYLEQNGYDVSYTSGQYIAQTSGSEIVDHKIFLSVGHDEYWSAEQFNGVMAARDAGVNLAFFSGNEVFWKTRWIADDAGNPYGTMVCYKETLDNALTDPSGIWTGTWADPRFSPPLDGGIAQNSLTGTLWTMNALTTDATSSTSFSLTSNFAALRFWRNTSVATLTGSKTLTVGDHVLGYEADSDIDNGFRPAGLIQLSATTVNASSVLQDYGATFAAATIVQNMTEYRAASGALVFSAGTVQYTWGLDNHHDVYSGAVDKNLQQATINLFADMGVQPTTLMKGLVAATSSIDHTAPTSIITSPVAGATISAGGSVTIKGTAKDTGGGVVGGVEVSVDGGLTWHPATGTTSWTYTFSPRSAGQFTIMSRATDDSLNIETPSKGVTVNPPQASATYNLFGNTTPTLIDSGDGNSITVGMRFQSDVEAVVTGLRFYKGANNTGTHTGSLWTSDGVLLATVTFTNETSSGWQSATFSSPVQIKANTPYVISYFAPNGHYSQTNGYFTNQGINNGPLHGLAAGPSGANGLFSYGGATFPVTTYAQANYWVDVTINTAVPVDTTAPTVVSYSPTNGTTALSTDSGIIIKFSEAIDPSTINSTNIQLINPDPTTVPSGCCGSPGGWCSGCPLFQGALSKVIPATISYDATQDTVTIIPTAPLSTLQTYTVVVKGGATGVADMAGNAVVADNAASFLTPALPASTWSSVWNTGTTTPGTVDSGDANPITVGMKFTPSSNGTIAGMTFYKAAGNIGIHTGSLWSSTGTLLATGTFTSETASGWQELIFSSPVAVTAGTTYVVSYYSNSGHYSADQGYFSSSYTSGPFTVPANGGLYLYGNGGFPTQTYNNTNYWVQPILRTAPPADTTSPLILGITPAANTTSVSTNPTITVAFSEALDPTTATANQLRLMDQYNHLVPTTVTYNSTTFTATITPTSALAFGSQYTVVVAGGAQGVRDLAGNPLATTIGSSFTTAGSPVADTTPPVVLDTSPANGATGYAVNGSIVVTFSEPLNAASVSGQTANILLNGVTRVPSTATYNAATNSITITPTTPLSYGLSYTVYIVGGSTGIRDLSGNALASNFASSFTTAAAPPPSSIWPSTTTPASTDSASQAVNVGVKFVPNTSGYITGIEFYKASNNTGTHTGSLWSSSGTLLATGTFSNETASGWQTLTFSTPIAVTAGTTYIASYLAPNGHFSTNSGYFNSSYTSGMLTVPANGGVFTYGSTNAFPTSTYSGSNYWVDVVFSLSPGNTNPPKVTAMSPVNGATNVSINASFTVTFDQAINPLSLTSSTLQLLDGSTLVSATISYNSSNNTATLTPLAPLSNSHTYTLSAIGGIPGLKNVAGVNLAQTVSETFTTAAADTTPPTVTGFTPANSATNVATTSTITISFSEALNAATVTSATIVLKDSSNAVVPSLVSYNAANNTVTLTPASTLSNSAIYTVTVVGGASGVTDAAGNALAANATSSFTTVLGTGTGHSTPTPSTIWTTSTKPATTDSGDAAAVEVGVKFIPSTSGFITGVEFYKATTNTGTHTGSLWSSTGKLLATGTFTNETASGWQTLTFSSPVAVTAGTTYVASYHTTVGHYSFSRSYFSSSYTSGSLQVPANGGVFIYGNSAFPSSSYQSSNYWVDVQFTTVDSTPPTVVSVTPVGASTNVATNVPVTVTFSEALTVASISSSTIQLRDSSNNLVAGSVTYNSTTKAATFTPTSALSNSTTYMLTVVGGANGVQDLAGNALATNIFSSFTTVAPADTTPPTVVSVSPAGSSTNVAINTPVTISFSEALSAASVTTSTIQLRNASNTLVTGSVAYNSSNNTATFTPSSALSNSTTYTLTVVSGASGVKDVAGNALASNLTSTFTTVALVDTTPPTVLSVSPAGSATNVATSATITVTFSEALTAASVSASTIQLRDSSNNLVAGTVAYNASNNTATFTPTSALSNSKSYTLTIVGGASGVKDLAGNALASNVTSSFSTVAPPDTTPPTIVTIAPAGTATGVAISTPVTVSFSEAVTAASVTTSTIQLRDAGNNLVAGSVTYNSSNNTATFTPSGALSNLTTYTLTVVGGASGVKDLAGNALASNSTSSFTTVADTTAPTIVSVTPAGASTGVATSATVTVTFSEALNAATISASTVQLRDSSNNLVAGTVSYNASTKTATFTPTSALSNTVTYTLTVVGGASGVQDAAGNALASNATSSFTTIASTATATLFSTSTTPATADSGDTRAIEVGVKFTANTNGYITGIQFYKATTNTGTHTGSLWSSSGTLLATGTFTSESASGWQTLVFSTPVAITAGTTYVASYHTTTGHYSYTYSTFSSSYTSGPLTVPANGGVYVYGNSAVPTSTYQATNYWVTPVFSYTPPVDKTPPTITAVTPAGSSTNVATSATVTATFSEALSVASVSSSTVQLRDSSNNLVAGTVSYNAATNTATFTPTSALSNSMTYMLTVVGGSSGVKDLAGNALAANTFSSFTTIAKLGTTSTVWPTTTTPATVDSGDTSSVELGMKFTANANGFITGIQFYKATGNTGTHTGSLWSSTGQLLATGTFTSESASGWQTLVFSTPVAITAGTTYVASYHTTVGHYSVSRSYFASSYTSGAFTVPANGGVFIYGNSAFPTSSYQSSNYWVQPVFAPLSN